MHLSAIHGSTKHALNPRLVLSVSSWPFRPSLLRLALEVRLELVGRRPRAGRSCQKKSWAPLPNTLGSQTWPPPRSGHRWSLRNDQMLPPPGGGHCAALVVALRAVPDYFSAEARVEPAMFLNETSGSADAGQQDRFQYFAKPKYFGTQKGNIWPKLCFVQLLTKFMRPL